MNYLLINPNSDAHTNHILSKVMDESIRANDSYQIISIDTMPVVIKTNQEYQRAIEEVQKLIFEQDKKKEFDAFVIACHSDPGLEEARKHISKPIYGIGEESFRYAANVPGIVGVVVVSEESIGRKSRMVEKFLKDRQCLFVVAKSDNYEDVQNASEELINMGAELVILGCANYFSYDEKIEEAIAHPVINGLKVLLRSDHR